MTKPTPEDRERSLAYAKGCAAAGDEHDCIANMARVLLDLHAQLAESERARGVLEAAIRRGGRCIEGEPHAPGSNCKLCKNTGLVAWARDALAADRQETKEVMPVTRKIEQRRAETQGSLITGGRVGTEPDNPEPLPPTAERPPEPWREAAKRLREALFWLPGSRPGDGERSDAAHADLDALETALASEAAAHDATKQELAELRALYNANAMKRENDALKTEFGHERMRWEAERLERRAELERVRGELETTREHLRDCDNKRRESNGWLSHLEIKLGYPPSTSKDLVERAIAELSALREGVRPRVPTVGALAHAMRQAEHAWADDPLDQRDEFDMRAEAVIALITGPAATETEAPSPLPEVLPAGTRYCTKSGEPVIAVTEAKLGTNSALNYVYWAQWGKRKDESYVWPTDIDWAYYRAQQVKAEAEEWAGHFAPKIAAVEGRAQQQPAATPARVPFAAAIGAVAASLPAEDETPLPVPEREARPLTRKTAATPEPIRFSEFIKAHGLRIETFATCDLSRGGAPARGAHLRLGDKHCEVRESCGLLGEFSVGATDEQAIAALPAVYAGKALRFGARVGHHSETDPECVKIQCPATWEQEPAATPAPTLESLEARLDAVLPELSNSCDTNRLRLDEFDARLREVELQHRVEDEAEPAMPSDDEIEAKCAQLVRSQAGDDGIWRDGFNTAKAALREERERIEREERERA